MNEPPLAHSLYKTTPAPESRPNAPTTRSIDRLVRSSTRIQYIHQQEGDQIAPGPPDQAKYDPDRARVQRTTAHGSKRDMVSLQSALLPEAASNKRPPCLSLAGGATSKKRRRDDDNDRDNSRGEVVDGIELNFDAAPLPPEWQRCLDIQSGQIHYYNTRTQKRTLKDPRDEPDYRAAAADEDDDSANCGPPGLDLELNLTFSPRRAVAGPEKKRPKPAADRRQLPTKAEDSREMVAGVCVRCHMLVMMCRANPACPNCKFLHPSTRAAPPPEPEPVPLKLGLQLLCCRD